MLKTLHLITNTAVHLQPQQLSSWKQNSDSALYFIMALYDVVL